MNSKIFARFSLFLIFAIVLAACGAKTPANSIQEKIIGTWQSTEGDSMIQFREDGTGISSGTGSLDDGIEITFKWVSSALIKMSFTQPKGSLTYGIEMVDDDTFTLWIDGYEGDKTTYMRVK